MSSIRKTIKFLANSIFSFYETILWLIEKVERFRLVDRPKYYATQIILTALYLLFLNSYFRFLPDTKFSQLKIMAFIVLAVICVLVYMALLYARHSVWYSTLNLIIINALVALVVSVNFVLFAYGETNGSFLLWIVVYGFLWISYSLIADPEVSRLTNEIIASVSVLSYTLIAYAVNMLSDKVIISNLCRLMPWTESQLLDLWNGLQANGYSFVQVLTVCTGVLLPYVGFSSISIVLVNLKTYCQKKNELAQP